MSPHNLIPTWDEMGLPLAGQRVVIKLSGIMCHDPCTKWHGIKDIRKVAGWMGGWMDGWKDQTETPPG